MKRLFKVLGITLVALVVATTIFGAGVYVGNSSSPLAVAGSFRPQEAPEEFPEEFDIFYQAWEIVQERFVDQEALDDTTLTYGAIEGMLKALGDEGHTDFLTPKELEYQRSDISGTYKGIGARLGVRDGLPIIVTPFDGSPADEAGVKAGDIIMEVDGEDTSGMELSEVVDRIRGPENTQVTLTVLRLDEAGNESLEIAITRQEIEIPATDWAMVPGTDVGYLRLTQFSANATEGIREAVAELEEAGAQAIVLDLRNNPGGLLEQAVKVTSQFLETGNVLQASAVSTACSGAAWPRRSRWWCWLTPARPARPKSWPARCRITTARNWWGKRPSARARCWNPSCSMTAPRCSWARASG
jgi:carboxyl-terminal processing protease